MFYKQKYKQCYVAAILLVAFPTIISSQLVEQFLCFQVSLQHPSGHARMSHLAYTILCLSGFTLCTLQTKQIILKHKIMLM